MLFDTDHSVTLDAEAQGTAHFKPELGFHRPGLLLGFILPNRINASSPSPSSSPSLSIPLLLPFFLPPPSFSPLGHPTVHIFSVLGLATPKRSLHRTTLALLSSFMCRSFLETAKGLQAGGSRPIPQPEGSWAASTQVSYQRRGLSD